MCLQGYMAPLLCHAAKRESPKTSNLRGLKYPQSCHFQVTFTRVKELLKGIAFPLRNGRG